MPHAIKDEQVFRTEIIPMDDEPEGPYREFTFVDGEPVEDGRIGIRRAGVQEHTPTPGVGDNTSW